MEHEVLWAVLVGLVMLAGLVGSAFLVLPGLALVWAAALCWALVVQSTAGWVVLAVATVVAAGASALMILVPGRGMKRAGIDNLTLLAGVVGAIVGAFVIPVVGLFVGFVAGIFLMQLTRPRSSGLTPWQATVHALRAVGTNILIELAADLLIIGAWLTSLWWVLR
ncbi:hypothetical protein SAMN05445756_0321 [Kytococcus aerolatus]|uniref:DUF456 domain-containing protein n=1 Tax=Kytococcus aerolatus TaxID=592308 RepID=A0A212T478_9MICO|nr:DUF456 domain-containing protein [Kytococcus aerolatus]SNC60646.1 hypothetical protein SAMN05445756_0321 [Kytococcus aerolatus]